MMGYTLKIESDKGPLILNWKNKDQLIKFSGIQTRSWNVETFDNRFKILQTRHWHQRWGTKIYSLPENGTVIDIGSGIGVSDLLLAKYRPDLNFNLYDKNEITPSGPFSWVDSTTAGFYYNSWDVTEDAILNSGINRSKFNISDPYVDWPEADLITSHWSWCHHYPVGTYLDKALNSLKKGGRLMVSVKVRADEDPIKIISDKLSSEPVLQIPYLLSDAPPQAQIIHPDVWAWDCIWIK